MARGETLAGLAERYYGNVAMESVLVAANYLYLQATPAIPPQRTGVPEDILRKLAAVAVEGSEAPKAKALREAYAIPDKPVGLEETRRIWREVAPLWIRQAEALGIKLD